MSFSIVSNTASVCERRGEYVWRSGLDSGPHTARFQKLSDAQRALKEAPIRTAMPVKILEIKGSKPKGKWVYIIYSTLGKNPWYVARIGTELKVRLCPDNIIRADVQHFASNHAARGAIRLLPDRQHAYASYMRVYI